MDLRPLADGRLVFGAQDPAWGVLDTQGKRLIGGDPPILDHRGNESKFRLARDGSSIEFSFDVWTNGKRQQRLARFDLRERRFELDVTPASALSAPRTDGLDIRDWRNNYKPTLNGKPLSLQQYEMSRAPRYRRGSFPLCARNRMESALVRPPGERTLEKASSRVWLGP